MARSSQHAVITAASPPSHLTSLLPALAVPPWSHLKTWAPPTHQAPQLQQGLAVFVCLLTIGCSALCLEKSELDLCGELGNVLFWFC